MKGRERAPRVRANTVHLVDTNGFKRGLGRLGPVGVLAALGWIAQDSAFEDPWVGPEAHGIAFLKHLGDRFRQEGRPATGGKSSRASRASAAWREGHW